MTTPSLPTASLPIEAQADATPLTSPSVVVAVSSWKWPRLWEYSLAFLLGICAVIILQSAWKLLQPPTPLLASAGSIDLNQADVNSLRQLPGVGPNLAARIVDHRNKNGPFAKIDDLQAVHGIGPTTLERLRYMVMVSSTGESLTPAPPIQTLRSGPKSTPSTPIDINMATAQQLMGLPGIGATMAERIIEDRNTNGLFNTVNDLTRIRGIKSKTLEKLLPYITAGKLEKHV